MPTLSVIVSDFTGPYASLNVSRPITVNERRAIKFAISIGLPILRTATPTSGHAVALAAYKSLAMKCAIDFTGPSLRQPRGYSNMDPSEKANISYWTGMAFAALISDQILGVPRLMHAAAFRRAQLARVNPLSRRLADLVGQDTRGAWHVVESKARQRKPTIGIMNRWKAQAQTIATINGSTPATRSYSLALVGGTYSARLVDPLPEDDQHEAHIEFESPAVTKGYYGPLVEWLSDGAHQVRRGDVGLMVKLVAFDPLDNEFLFLGLREDVLDAVQYNEAPPIRKPHDSSDAYIGSDGIAVVTSLLQDIP